MFKRHESIATPRELRARVARLTSAADHFQHRIEAHGRQFGPAKADGHKLVQDRMFWILARLHAQRQVAERQLARILR